MAPETLPQLIGSALTIGLTIWLSTVLTRSAARTDVRVNANRPELRMHALYVWMGWGSLLITVAFALVTINSNDPQLYVLGPITMLLFGWIGSWMLLSYYRHRVSWDASGVSIFNQWNKETFLPWEDIQAVSYEKSLGRFRLRTKNKSRYTLSAALVGLKAFFLVLDDKTGIQPDGEGLPQELR